MKVKEPKEKINVCIKRNEFEVSFFKGYLELSTDKSGRLTNIIKNLASSYKQISGEGGFLDTDPLKEKGIQTYVFCICEGVISFRCRNESDDKYKIKMIFSNNEKAKLYFDGLKFR